MITTIKNVEEVIDKILYFIDEGCNDELDAALQAGFDIKDRYKCYRCVL